MKATERLTSGAYSVPALKPSHHDDPRHVTGPK